VERKASDLPRFGGCRAGLAAQRRVGVCPCAALASLIEYSRTTSRCAPGCAISQTCNAGQCDDLVYGPEGPSCSDMSGSSSSGGKVKQLLPWLRLHTVGPGGYRSVVLAKNPSELESRCFPHVAVVKPTDLRHLNDAPQLGFLHRSGLGGVAVQRQVTT
jgi:hypothetical protein